MKHCLNCQADLIISVQPLCPACIEKVDREAELMRLWDGRPRLGSIRSRGARSSSSA